MRRFARFLSVAIGWLLLLRAALCPLAAMAADANDGFRTIFDGKTLDGWDGNPELWRVEEGAITGETTKEFPANGNTFLIWCGGEPATFELKAEFRMPNPGFANSGIQIRSWDGPEKWLVSGYQLDMDGENKYTGFCYGENYRGVLAERGQKVIIGKDHKPKVVEQFADSKELAKLIKKRDWNEYHIIAQGNHIIQKINGQLMCEVTDEDTLARKDGIIALQLHAGPPMKVQFRNIRLKEPNADQSVAKKTRPKRVYPPRIDAVAAGAKAIEMFDTNKDGKISGAELDKCPGLKAAIDKIDPAGKGEISANLITARINAWKRTRLGRLQLLCRVMHNGKPLAGAEVKFVPEKFLGENVKVATGETDEDGMAILSIPRDKPEDLPGVQPGFYRVEVTKTGVNIPAKYNTETIFGQEIALDVKGIQEAIRADAMRIPRIRFDMSF